MGTGLRTDRYELTMVDAALRSGVAEHRAVFEVFARGLPPGRRYGVVAGTHRVAEAVERFRFTDPELSWLATLGCFSPEALDWFARYRFSGDIDAYAEGELWFPGSPVLTVEAGFAEALVLETIVLSILNHDAAVAAAAARMHEAAAGKALVEMGGRRTHEEAAVAAARAAYLAGFASTSNLEAGRRYGIPTLGTVGHAFVLAHGDEAQAFAAQVKAMGADSTFLVDTFDIETGIRRAVEAAGPRLGAVRIDSGDLAEEARRARALLDRLGATGTRIVLTGDLDEHRIADLAAGPADAFGLGTQLVTGGGEPTAGFVYKLVAVAAVPGPDAPLRPVEKRSAGKATSGGRKHAWRVIDRQGQATGEHVTADSVRRPPPSARPLQRPLVRAGDIVAAASLDAARRHHLAARAELSPAQRELCPGPPAFVAAGHPTDRRPDPARNREDHDHG